MRKLVAAMIVLGMVGVSGCSSTTAAGLGGAAVGAAAGAGSYEYHLKKMRDRVQADFDAKKIDKREYDIRMDQISRDSVF